MLLIPKIFNPKNGNYFSKMTKVFRTLWIELTLPYKKFLPLFVNVSYNTEKSKIDIFLEELALQIDYGITKKYTMKKQNGHNSFSTLLSISGQQNIYMGKNLIDFVIKDDDLLHSNVFTFELLITLDQKAIAKTTNVTS